MLATLLRYHWLVLFMATLSVSAAPAQDAGGSDPVGTWTWERTMRDRTVTSVLRISRKDGRLVGTYRGFRDEEVPIEVISFADGKLKFQFNRSFNDRQFTITYEGEVGTDSIRGMGKFSGGDREREWEWEAKRTLSLADVLGLWHFEFETPNGDKMQTSLRLATEGDKVLGRYTSQRGEREAKEIKVENNELSFELTAETDNGSFWARYHGRVSGNSIQGKIDYRFGDNEGSVEFAGKREVEQPSLASKLVGEWTLEMTRDNGEKREWTLTVSEKEGKLVAVQQGRRGEQAIDELKFDGENLSFAVSRQTDNGTFRRAFSGKVDGDTLRGTVSFQFGDRSGTREIIGHRKAAAKPAPEKVTEKPQSTEV